MADTRGKLLKKYLHDAKRRMSKEENRAYDNPITWRELADRAGVPEQNMYSYKDGRHVPSYEYALKLAAVVGMELMDILDYPRSIDPIYRALEKMAEIDPEAARIMKRLEGNNGENNKQLKLGEYEPA